MFEPGPGRIEWAIVLVLTGAAAFIAPYLIDREDAIARLALMAGAAAVALLLVAVRRRLISPR